MKLPPRPRIKVGFTRKLKLTVLDASFAICKLAPDVPIPSWASGGSFLSVTRTPEELSIVCEQDLVPETANSQRDWRCLQVAGPLNLSEAGILASLSFPLAEAGINIFTISTVNTDYILVPAQALKRTEAILSQQGHHVENDETRNTSV